MELATQIYKFIESPFPLWETTLTHELIKDKWRELKKIGFQNFEDYSTARFWLGDSTLEIDKKKEIANSTLCIEMPSFQLQSFSTEQGLELLTENEIGVGLTLSKIKSAISILRINEPVLQCISDLIRSIHVLRQPESEIDVSYSHPRIPFSIFLSVCEDNSTISSLRVAESILHEAMHLKLTLIENLVPLIKPDANSLSYSPWRDEQRPIQGILHGLFVFRSIKEFYVGLYQSGKLSKAEEYLQMRITQIECEIGRIYDFKTNSSLTKEGATLVTSLLPSS